MSLKPSTAVSYHKYLKGVTCKKLFSFNYLSKYTFKPTTFNESYSWSTQLLENVRTTVSGDLHPVVDIKTLEPPRALPLQHHTRRSLLQRHTRCRSHGAR